MHQLANSQNPAPSTYVLEATRRLRAGQLREPRGDHDVIDPSRRVVGKSRARMDPQIEGLREGGWIAYLRRRIGPLRRSTDRRGTAAQASQ